MRNIRIYNEHKNNLCSIKPIDNDLSGRIYLCKLLEKHMDNSILYVKASKPYYDINGLKDSLINSFNKVLGMSYSEDFFEVEFYIDTQYMNFGLYQLLVDIWFRYEQPIFLIAETDLDSIIALELLNNNKKKWLDVTQSIKAYMFFRSAEEDVIWIGKNDILDFKIA